MKKVISFCLYGTNATYILGMTENILLAKQYFPDWIVRIYYNSTVPDKYINEFKNLNAECILKENLGKNKLNWEGMFWRWMPLDDNDVTIWISRDADSRLSEREAKLVKEWEDSGKTLHSIRDHRCHMHCIMGGMFGINNTSFHSRYKFDKVEDIIKNNISIYNERPYNVDQEFLNKYLWDLLKNDVTAHISNQGRRVYDSDIEIPSVPDFIGKQYRIDDFPENKLKHLQGKSGCYWKKSNSPQIYWSNSTINISADFIFSSEGEFYNHRSDHGYPQNWSQINILDGIVINKPIESKPPIDKHLIDTSPVANSPTTNYPNYISLIDKANDKANDIGCYWKLPNDSKVHWSNSSQYIKPDILFKNETEYFQHRVKHGYPRTWTGIKTHIVNTIDNTVNTIDKTVNNSYSYDQRFKNLNTSFFERIYIIHLNRLDDRKKNILNQIEHLNNVIIIDAVDKDRLNIDELKRNNLIGYPGNNYCKDSKKCWCGGNGHNDMMKTGRIACAWSHSKAYEHIITNHVSNALIIEDDFLLCNDFIKLFKDIQCNIPQDYDILYMAHNKHLNRTHNTIYNNYFNKINTGLAETSCYAITNKTAFNLQQNLFPIRGAADGYIRQCIDYLKTVKNVYICKYNLVANQSMSSKIKSTIDISIESNMNTDTSNGNSLINNVLEKKSLEYEPRCRNNDILIVTGFWKIKEHKYTGNDCYDSWITNTLQINNDVCFIYDNNEIFNKIKTIRSTCKYKTFYIKRNLDNFRVNKFNWSDISYNSLPDVKSEDLAKIWAEKIYLVNECNILYPEYKWYGWMDAGLPIYRNGINTSLRLTNYYLLDENKFNCNFSHLPLSRPLSDVNQYLDDYANNKFTNQSYYHHISGSGFIIHYTVTNKFLDLYDSQLKYLMTHVKNKANNLMLTSDQCVWTQIYSKNKNDFNILKGKYGDIYNSISKEVTNYKIFSTGGFGNQMIHLLYTILINKDINKVINFNLNYQIFKYSDFFVKMNCLLDRNFVSPHIFKGKDIDIKNNELKYVFNKYLKPHICFNKYNSYYDTVIHIRSEYDTGTDYYLQPNIIYYDYIFNNFDLGKDIAIVYGLPKNPIVDEISKKYNITHLITDSIESDFMTMVNCKNLIWDTSTLCWSAYLFSDTIERNFIFSNFKKYVKLKTFEINDNFIYIDTNYAITKHNINNIKIEELNHYNGEYKLNEPLVSIAISTYEANGKGKELLKNNLEYIHKQNYYNIEVVVSDHSSDDTIKNLCDHFNKCTTTYFKYPIKYIHNPEEKGNSSHNTNNAIKYCNGEYIKILFMDDYLYNESAISNIVAHFQSNPDKKWLVHSYIHTKNYNDFYNLHHPKFSDNMIFCNRIGCPSCLTIHCSITERFDEKLKWFMDSELYSRIRQKYNEPIILHTNANDKAYMVNLHHENQVTNTSIDKSLIQKEKDYINNKMNLYLLETNKYKLDIIESEFNNYELNLPELQNKLTTLQNKLKLKYGNWNDEYQEQILSLNYIKSDSCVLELGGNIGRNSMIISLLLDDPTRLVVIEPSKKIYEQLMENKTNNNLNFNTECLAVSEKRLWSSKWNTFSEYKQGSEEVDTISFDKLKDKYQYNFDTLVCDCEGALYYILLDNENILKDIHTIIIENDFTDINHKIYVDDVFKKFDLKCVYQKEGDNYVKTYLPCKQNFYEVWQKK